MAGRILQYQNQPTSADFPQVTSMLSHCSKSFNSAGITNVAYGVKKRVPIAIMDDNYSKSLYGTWIDASL